MLEFVRLPAAKTVGRSLILGSFFADAIASLFMATFFLVATFQTLQTTVHLLNISSAACTALRQARMEPSRVSVENSNTGRIRPLSTGGHYVTRDETDHHKRDAQRQVNRIGRHAVKS